MEQTTTRTEMITGFMLNHLNHNLYRLSELEPAVYGHKTREQLVSDQEYMEALKIVSNLLHREMHLNLMRDNGSAACSLDDINEITMTEA